MKFIDLCCGIGGFHQALSNLGMECVLASDIDKDCRKNYELNYGIKPKGDLKEINIPTIPSFDILCAGFSCQPFSKAGKQDGFDDKRGNLFFNICNIIEYHKPKYLILENVRNLVSHNNGTTWDIIYNKIIDMGYKTYKKPLILNTLQFGIPQSRERVIILCSLKDLPSRPLIKKLRNCSLKDIIEDSNEEKYKLTDRMKAAEEVWDKFLKILKDNNIPVPKFPIWTDWWDSDGENTRVTKGNNKEVIKERQKAFYEKYTKVIDKNRQFYHKHKRLLLPWLNSSRENPKWIGAIRKMEWQTGKDNLTMKEVLWSPRGSGIRIKCLDYSPTLVAMTSMIPIYGPKSRQLTPRECARLQSFPDSFIIDKRDKIAYKQFGNAVNVKMIEQCANFLINNKPLF